MTTAVLRPAEDPSSEIVVVISPVPVGALFDCLGRAGAPPRTRKAYEALAERFIPFVQSWTYGHPVTAAGFLELDYNLGLAVVHQWAREVAQAPLPLLLSSSDGEPSEEPAAPSP